MRATTPSQLMAHRFAAPSLFCQLMRRSTALKELYEETGYGSGKEGGNASVEDVSSVMVKDPGYVYVSVPA